jgi:hypothetical protein
MTISYSFSELHLYLHTILTDVWNILPSKWIRNTSGYSSLILRRLHSWKTADYIFMLCITIKDRGVWEYDSEWLYQAKYMKDYKKLTMMSGQWLVNRFLASLLRFLHDPLHTSRICKRIFIQKIGVGNPIKVMIEFDMMTVLVLFASIKMYCVLQPFHIHIEGMNSFHGQHQNYSKGMQPENLFTNLHLD